MLIIEDIVLNLDDRRIEELCNLDPQIKKLTYVIGDLSILIRKDHFQSLVTSIIGQQLSVKAASTINSRVNNLLHNNLNYQSISCLSDEELQGVGVSKRKVTYIRDLVHKVKSKEINLSQVHQLDNNNVIKILTSVKGIGIWTAEMFLIFSLGRLNVLSLNDIGIQRSVRWLYGLSAEEDMKKFLVEKSKLWSPYNTIVSIYLWEAVNRGFVTNYESIDTILVNKKSN
ncbi:DNA-3-methyladenine glycosylase 2 family protein [Priestia aryabhattai]|uniref:DNA-3-methyladenine glycosylase family protein n=1 Tax=Priestia aryabhattai TaxID=412384 RepID=UPI003100BA9E